MQTGGGRPADLVSGHGSTVRTGPVERVRCVEGKERLVAEIASYACSGLAAMISRDAANRHSIYGTALQLFVEIRLTVKGRMQVLGDQKVRFAADCRLDPVPRLAGSQRRGQPPF